MDAPAVLFGNNKKYQFFLIGRMLSRRVYRVYSQYIIFYLFNSRINTKIFNQTISHNAEHKPRFPPPLNLFLIFHSLS